ncbi:GNAT family N-acetyltransferase [Aestuariirhabdus sp. Z084]|uniref:GNAT family N-acetyltransferase n=1 Tax=Aestuariirhabdus haliotis TaxID=2918751 RepID=UPI00201B3D2C|nr:GNAT family N-acetyltransferase [Aestuariirhabdus haliotis]MCL6416546.1 GNAT family N-acetyltransferase [Aestuariirhabdus haliotis]MCL6420536.1 GNAT family N-acetyltransferase [Aestuariirhabdus haliotis]
MIEFQVAKGSDIPLALLLEADPSELKINKYRSKSSAVVAVKDDDIVGACLLLPLDASNIELINIAVDPGQQGKGIGVQLLQRALGFAREQGYQAIELTTGTFGYQLAFYQRQGFRAVELVRDYFLNQYPQLLIEDGIQHKDMLRLRLQL